MVTFQLFVLECYKTQEKLQKMISEINEDLLIKREISTNIVEEPMIKSEVNITYFINFFMPSTCILNNVQSVKNNYITN